MQGQQCIITLFSELLFSFLLLPLLFFFFHFLIFGTEQHFPEVMLGEEFLSLSLDQVCSLISSDKLTVSSEEKVCSAWPLGERGASQGGGHGRDLWFSETFPLL